MKRIILLLIVWSIGCFGQSITITKRKITFRNDQLYNILKDKKAVIKSIDGKTWVKIPRGGITFSEKTGFYMYNNYIIRRAGGITDNGSCISKSINFNLNTETQILDGDSDAFFKPIDEGKFPPDAEESVPIEIKPK